MIFSNISMAKRLKSSLKDNRRCYISVSVLKDSALDLILQWPQRQTEVLCGKLMRVTACPRTLKRVLDKGISCTDLVDVTAKGVRN